MCLIRISGVSYLTWDTSFQNKDVKIHFLVSLGFSKLYLAKPTVGQNGVGLNLLSGHLLSNK